jgi:hypothetical protein
MYGSMPPTDWAPDSAVPGPQRAVFPQIG